MKTTRLSDDLCLKPEVIEEPLPLKRRILVEKSVVWVKRENGFTKTIPWTENPGKSKENSVLVKAFLHFTKTTASLPNFSVLKAGVLKSLPMKPPSLKILAISMATPADARGEKLFFVVQSLGSDNYPRQQNNCMQLFLFSGSHVLMITITFLNP